MRFPKFDLENNKEYRKDRKERKRLGDFYSEHEDTPEGDEALRKKIELEDKWPNAYKRKWGLGKRS